MSVPEKLFKVSLHLANFAKMNIFEIRKVQFDEIVYLYHALIEYDFDDMVENGAVQGAAVPAKGGRRKKYADEVDWFD